MEGFEYIDSNLGSWFADFFFTMKTVFFWNRRVVVWATRNEGSYFVKPGLFTKKLEFYPLVMTNIAMV